jgi:hypothetical protein
MVTEDKIINNLGEKRNSKKKKKKLNIYIKKT